jgi:CheY-like chemotaxis protein
MPDMDGVETARAIRAVVGCEVTIIMTAYDWTDIEERARAAGVDFFLKKPVFPAALAQLFARASRDRQDQPPLPAYDFTGRRVLLAEDNEINAEIACSLLGLHHCQVDVAENGATAIETFAGSPVGRYDAILMDVRMPVMDGLEAARTIRAMKRSDAKTIPILAMTANAFQDDVQASLDSGMNAHLAKPIEPAILYEALDRWISGRR